MKRILILSLFLSITVFPAVISAQIWLTDINTAKASAEAESKDVLLIFQGSDWCAPCMKFKKRILDTEEFAQYAADHLILLQADFPRRKKNALPKALKEHNNALAEQYNQRGIFPLAVLLNSSGQVLKKFGYDYADVQDYIQLIENQK